jgi:hypothetical protein
MRLQVGVVKQFPDTGTGGATAEADRSLFEFLLLHEQPEARPVLMQDHRWRSEALRRFEVARVAGSKKQNHHRAGEH